MSSRDRVCPRCGTPAVGIWCAGCGLNLKQQAELPSREAYEAKSREQSWLSERRKAEEEQRRRELSEQREREERVRQEELERRRLAADRRRQTAERKASPYVLAGVVVLASLAVVLALVSGSDGGVGNLDPDSPIDSGGDIPIVDHTGETLAATTVESTLRNTLAGREAPIKEVACTGRPAQLEDGDELSCDVQLANGRTYPLTATAMSDGDDSFSLRIDVRY